MARAGERSCLNKARKAFSVSAGVNIVEVVAVFIIHEPELGSKTGGSKTRRLTQQIRMDVQTIRLPRQ